MMRSQPYFDSNQSCIEGILKFLVAQSRIAPWRMALRCCRQPRVVGSLPRSGFAGPNDRRYTRVLADAAWNDPNFLRRLDQVNADIMQLLEW